MATRWPSALNGTFKAELIEMQGPWRDVAQVERAIFQWVAWYNDERLHSALRLRTARRVRTRLVATTGSHPAFRLEQDHRTLRNSGQLTSKRLRDRGPSHPHCRIPANGAPAVCRTLQMRRQRRTAIMLTLFSVTSAGVSQRRARRRAGGAVVARHGRRK
ncbi:integrase core domain-containing protein [Streptomyces bobili]|uniref:integrase core domain-containing protein n=1 Tax=Streptomyces bobili TaxID=67280 RepID=UPI003F541AB5